MNICVPVKEDKGLQSPISEHFGSAPLFVVFDTESGTVRALPNRNLQHAHGLCQPLLSLAGERVDGVVVGGIGMGAMTRLQAAGIRVFLSGPGTVAEAVDAYKAGTLREATPATACGQHGHGPHGHGPCAHGPHGHGGPGGRPGR